jgi:hypothetical protein
MAVEWLEVSLSGYGGSKPTGMRFFELVGLKPKDGFETSPSDEEWESARIILLAVSIEDCKPGTERYEEFEARIAKGLKRAAKWLSTRKPAAFAKWRKERKKAEIFIDGWMNSDQFDLTLPPEFVRECGRLGLPVVICTND